MLVYFIRGKLKTRMTQRRHFMNRGLNAEVVVNVMEKFLAKFLRLFDALYVRRLSRIVVVSKHVLVV